MHWWRLRDKASSSQWDEMVVCPTLALHRTRCTSNDSSVQPRSSSSSFPVSAAVGPFGCARRRQRVSEPRCAGLPTAMTAPLPLHPKKLSTKHWKCLPSTSARPRPQKQLILLPSNRLELFGVAGVLERAFAFIPSGAEPIFPSRSPQTAHPHCAGF